MSRPTFTVTAERGSRRWVLQCVEHPGAISEVTRLDEAADTIREAIAFVAQVPEESFDVDVQADIPADAVEHALNAKRLRESSLRDQTRSAEEYRRAALILSEKGLSLRDIGRILGVSFQRAHQLVTEAADETRDDPGLSA